MNIISLTSIPSRYPHLRPVLERLLSQKTTFPFKLNLYISDESDYKPFDNRINVIKVKDKGPHTKICYALKEAEGYVITADDDVLYPDNWADTLFRSMHNDNSKAYCFRGRIISPSKDYKQSRLILCTNIEKNNPIEIITGTWGAIYNPKHFDESFFSPPDIFNRIDDIWISGYLSKNGIAKEIISYKGIIRPSKSNEIDSLWSKNKNGLANNKGIQYFKDIL